MRLQAKSGYSHFFLPYGHVLKTRLQNHFFVVPLWSSILHALETERTFLIHKADVTGKPQRMMMYIMSDNRRALLGPQILQILRPRSNPIIWHVNIVLVIVLVLTSLASSSIFKSKRRKLNIVWIKPLRPAVTTRRRQ